MKNQLGYLLLNYISFYILRKSFHHMPSVIRIQVKVSLFSCQMCFLLSKRKKLPYKLLIMTSYIVIKGTRVIVYIYVFKNFMLYSFDKIKSLSLTICMLCRENFRLLLSTSVSVSNRNKLKTNYQ